MADNCLRSDVPYSRRQAALPAEPCPLCGQDFGPVTGCSNRDCKNYNVPPTIGANGRPLGPEHRSHAAFAAALNGTVADDPINHVGYNGRGDWMLTFTGRQFWPFAPRAADVDLLDIAHALANLCRYCGHTRQFYSVAQHSVMVSETLQRVNGAFSDSALTDAQVGIAIRWGLLHDAAEAYISDVIRPLKKAMWFNLPPVESADGWRTAPGMANVAAVEERIERAVAERFGFVWSDVQAVSAAVKAADNRLLMTERRDLMSDKGPAWHKWAEPLPELIEECWQPHRAEQEFLIRAGELGIK